MNQPTYRLSWLGKSQLSQYIVSADSYETLEALREALPAKNYPVVWSAQRIEEALDHYDETPLAERTTIDQRLKLDREERGGDEQERLAHEAVLAALPGGASEWVCVAMSIDATTIGSGELVPGYPEGFVAKNHDAGTFDVIARYGDESEPLAYVARTQHPDFLLLVDYFDPEARVEYWLRKAD